MKRGTRSRHPLVFPSFSWPSGRSLPLSSKKSPILSLWFGLIKSAQTKAQQTKLFALPDWRAAKSKLLPKSQASKPQHVIGEILLAYVGSLLLLSPSSTTSTTLPTLPPTATVVAKSTGACHALILQAPFESRLLAASLLYLLPLPLPLLPTPPPLPRAAKAGKPNSNSTRKPERNR